MTGVTPAEFLAIIPKKDKEDHERDKEKMKKITETVKGIDLKPRMDLEEAIKAVRKFEEALKADRKLNEKETSR
jgi:alcohol dehydrogenase YqhD (iron-dependent ADH family)